MRRLLPGLLLVLLAAACGTAAPGLPRHQQAAPAASATPPPASTAAGYALPDRTLTPGAAGTDITQICPHVSPALEKARPSTAAKARVFAAYRIPAAQRHLYVIDHDIPLELDGQNVAANEWPQPAAQARAKDRVEAALHDAVCAGRVSLRAAQVAIAADWRTAAP